MLVDGTEERWKLEWNLMVHGTEEEKEESVKEGLQMVDG
jgi:hypothetical protein